MQGKEIKPHGPSLNRPFPEDFLHHAIPGAAAFKLDHRLVADIKGPSKQANVAQSVEQLIRNQQAVGSIPIVGSMKK